MRGLSQLAIDFASRISQEAALLRRNVRSRRGRFLVGSQRAFVLHDILPEEDFAHLRKLAIEHRSFFRRKDSFVRRGAAVGGQALRRSPCAPIVDRLVCGEFLERVRSRTGIAELQYVPPVDTNQIGLLYYGNPGDGIDWHVDGTIYLGDRWAGILTLVEDVHDVDSKLELRPGGESQTYPADQMANTLVLFQGDQVRHRVRPMSDGEERLVVSLLFATNPERTRNPLLRLYQAWVNYIFYGDPRA